jgi:hypothetical protein
MITQTSLIFPINAVKGQLVNFTLSYQSTSPLVGQLVEVNLGLFTNQLLPNPQSYAWQVPYNIGSQAMNFVLPSDKSRNLNVEFEGVTSTFFKIRVEFLMVADIDGFLSDIVFDNFQTFANSQAINNSSIYQIGQKNIWVALKVGNFTRNTPIPVTSSSDCIGSLITIAPLYTVGQDLTINFQAGQFTDFEYYVLVYNKSQITNGVNFVQDLQINYARIDNQSNAEGSLSNAAILSGNGFVNGQAVVTIAGSYFQPNNVYEIIPIYRESGSWKNCPIEIQANQAGFSPIVGDILCENSVIGFPFVGTQCCGTDIAEGERVQVKFTLPKTSWNTEISNFFAGNFDDYFVSASVAWSTQAPINSPVLSTPLDNVIISNTTANFVISGNFVPPSNGVFYALLTIRMQYPTHEDIIVKPLRLGIFAPTISIPFNVLDGDGMPVDNEICIQQNGDITVTYTPTPSDSKLYYSINGGAWQVGTIGALITGFSNGAITLDVNVLGNDNQICFKLVNQGDGDPSTGVDPSCEFCDDDTNAFITLNIPALNAPQSLTIDFFDSSTIGTYTLSQPGFGSDSGALTNFQQILLLANNTYPITLTLDTIIGDCFYTETFVINQNWGANNPLSSPSAKLEVVQLPLSGCVPPQLPLPDTCDNTASIIHQCLPDIATIDIAFTESFTSPVDDDIQEISLDGGLTWIPAPLDVTDEPFVLIRRLVTFTDGCPGLNLYQTVFCNPETECNNSRLIEFIVDENDLLTITLTDDFNSGVDTDLVQVSLDGGLTFAPYAAPIQLTGGEEVVITSLVTFDDNCPALTFSTSFINDITAQCDYSQFEFECVYDENTETFTFDYSGDESLLDESVKEYSIDGGVTWIPYVGAISADFVLGRWIVKYENCEKHVIVRGCQSGCKKVEICSPVTVKVDGCVDICGDCDPEEKSKGLC